MSPVCPLQDTALYLRPPELPHAAVSPSWSPLPARACWLSPPGHTWMFPSFAPWDNPWTSHPGHECPFLGPPPEHVHQLCPLVLPPLCVPISLFLHVPLSPGPCVSVPPPPPQVPVPEPSPGGRDPVPVPCPAGPASQAGALPRRLPRATWQEGRVLSQITHPSRLVGQSSGGEVPKHQLDTRVRHEPGGGGGGGGPVSDREPPTRSLPGVPGRWHLRVPRQRHRWPSHTPACAGVPASRTGALIPQGPSRCRAPRGDTDLCRKIPLNLGTGGERVLGETKREHRNRPVGPARTGSGPWVPPGAAPQPSPGSGSAPHPSPRFGVCFGEEHTRPIRPGGVAVLAAADAGAHRSPCAPEKGEMRSCCGRRGDLHRAGVKPPDAGKRRQPPRWRGARAGLAAGGAAAGPGGARGWQSPLRQRCRTPGCERGPGHPFPVTTDSSSSRAAPGSQRGDGARRGGFGFSAVSPPVPGSRRCAPSLPGVRPRRSARLLLPAAGIGN